MLEALRRGRSRSFATPVSGQLGLARASGYRSRDHRRDSGARRVHRRCCCTATTTSCRSATSRSGSRRRSRRPSATGRSTGAAPPTRSRTSSCTSARCAPGSGKPPVGIKVVIEGMEEVGSAFTTFPPTHPDLFAADAMVIGDMGSVRPGVPTLTSPCAAWPMRDRRGAHAGRAEAQRPVRGRRAGCADRADPRARDACTTRTAMSPSPGLRREEWTGASYSDEEFRDLAEVAGRHAVLRHRRPRRADLVGPCDDGDRARRAAGGRSRERRRAVRARQDQPARPSRAGSA